MDIEFFEDICLREDVDFSEIVKKIVKDYEVVRLNDFDKSNVKDNDNPYLKVNNEEGIIYQSSRRTEKR